VATIYQRGRFDDVMLAKDLGHRTATAHVVLATAAACEGWPKGTIPLPLIERKFYSAQMAGPDPDRLRYAQMAGAAARHARAWLTADEEAAAVAELKEAAAGRADLLAECAGTALGFGEGGQDAARYRLIAELCMAAGADQALIERWITVGRQRAAIARAMPHAGPRMGE
jgi:hypothetical protein